MAGVLYGVGVGPGDPELITLKAVKVLSKAAVIGIPNKEKEESVAYRIARSAVPQIASKEHLCMDMPMTKDLDCLEQSYQKAAEAVIKVLDSNKDLAMVTLGDATIYATCTYVMEKVKQAGYTICYINGIPSFCAVASRLNIPLVGRKEELHIIPASYHIEEALLLPGVVVLMKAASNIKHVKQLLKESGRQVRMIERCGMEDEKVYDTVDQIPEDASYYSLLIVW